MSLTYSDKLRDPKWQKRRLEILSRDNFTCIACGNESQELHVHHSFYTQNRDPWYYPDWSLSCICKDCHKFINVNKLGLEFESIMHEMCSCMEPGPINWETVLELSGQICACKKAGVPFIDVLMAITNLRINYSQPEPTHDSQD